MKKTLVMVVLALGACTPPEQTKLESNDTGLADTGTPVDTEDT